MARTINDEEAPPSSAPEVGATPTAKLRRWDTLVANPRARSLASVFIILVISFFTYYRNYQRPDRLFWDENYHVPATERYVEGIAQFEYHPPLGKLLTAAGEVLTRSNRGVDKTILTTEKIIPGDRVPRDFSIAGMRLMPTLFAWMSAVLVYGLMRTLTGSRKMGLLFSSLYLLENAYIVHFRAVHLDSFQFFFVVATFWRFVHLWKQQDRLSWKSYFWMSALAGLALMVKVNAALLFALFPVLLLKDLGSQKNATKTSLVIDSLRKVSASVFALASVIVLVFTVHMASGRNMPDTATHAGHEDIEAMSPDYRKAIAEHKPFSPLRVFGVMGDYYKFMKKANASVPKLEVCKAEGENGSNPLSWLVMQRTINYRWDGSAGKTSYQQLVGNRVSWILGLTALILSAGIVLGHRVLGAPNRNKQAYALIEVFLGLYVVYLGLHLFLASQRVMYLYHYFHGLFITFLLVPLVWMYLEEVHSVLKRHRYAILLGMVGCVYACFLFTSPLTYHRPLTKTECERRNWLGHVVNCQ